MKENTMSRAAFDEEELRRDWKMFGDDVPAAKVTALLREWRRELAALEALVAELAGVRGRLRSGRKRRS
jgi:hypothetical protein